MGSRRLARALVVAALILGGALASPPAASATPTCTFDDASDTMNVSFNTNGDVGEIQVFPDNTIHIVGASDNPCPGAGGPPNTTNIDTINVFDNSDDPSTGAAADGSTTLSILDPAKLTPGVTQENGSNAFSEIEVNALLGAGSADRVLVFGADTGNVWRFGTAGLNWNAGVADPSPDADVVPVGQPDRWELRGGLANDTISGQGQSGTSNNPFNGPGKLTIWGDQGSDTIEGGNAAAGDLLQGVQGDDSLSGFGGDDTLAGFSGTNTLDGGPGSDTATYDQQDSPDQVGVNVDLSQTGPQNTGLSTDTLAGIENLDGSKNADTLSGDGGPNVLQGKDGDDSLDGRAGNDTLFGGDLGSLIGNDGADTLAGGPGNDNISGGPGLPDTVTYEGAPAGVTASLKEGTAFGDGSDNLFGLENLIGSPFDDDLTGDDNANSITPLGGNDLVSALAGPDTVNVRDGGPDTASCGSEIDSAIADQQSVDSINPDCETVDFLPEATAADTSLADTSLKFDLSGAKTQKLLTQKAVIVKARCPLEACSARASGSGKLPRLHRGARAAALTKISLKPLTKQIAAGVRKTIKLRLKKKQLSALKAALKARKRPKVTVTVRATDAAGNRVTRTLTVKAKS